MRDLFAQVLSIRHGTAAHVEKYLFGAVDNHGQTRYPYRITDTNTWQVQYEWPIEEVLTKVVKALNIISTVTLNGLFYRPSDELRQVYYFNPYININDINLVGNTSERIQGIIDANIRIAQTCLSSSIRLNDMLHPTAKNRIKFAMYLLSTATTAYSRVSAVNINNGNTFNTSHVRNLAYETVCTCSLYQAIQIINHVTIPAG